MLNSEEQWKSLPFAARNKELIKRWKHQIKVSKIHIPRRKYLI